MEKREIEYLYSKTVSRVFSSPENLVPFLRSSAWLYKYSFENQVLIHAQIKNSTAVATFEQWKRLGRSVNRGSVGCYHFSDDARGFRKDLFDVSDTNGDASTLPELWKLTDNSINLSIYIYQQSKEVTETLTYALPDESFHSVKDIQSFMAYAVEYIVSARLGLDMADREKDIFMTFGYIKHLAEKSLDDIIEAGKIISKSSEQILREFERRIKNEQYNRDASSAAGVQNSQRPDLQAGQGKGSILSGHGGRGAVGDVRRDASQGIAGAQRQEILPTDGEGRALRVSEAEQRGMLPDSGGLHGQRDRAGAGGARRAGAVERASLGEGARAGNGGAKPKSNVTLFGRIAKSLKIVKEQAAQEKPSQMSLDGFSFSDVNLPSEEKSPTLRDILDGFTHEVETPETAVSATQEEPVFTSPPMDDIQSEPAELVGQKPLVESVDSVELSDTEIEESPPQQELPIRQSFHYPDDLNAGDFESGAKSRCRDNLEAIQTLNDIDLESRAATPDEQSILAKYAGWGGIPEIFDDNNRAWSEERAELVELLSDADYVAARASTTTSFYTPLPVIRAIYSALERFGLPADARILEPSAGTGRFFGALPQSLNKAKLYGVELDGVSARIAAKLYPDATVRRGGFEDAQFSNNQFDVSVGNVPFGNYQLADPYYDKYHFLIHDYFFAKALDKVRPGGIVAFVTSTGTMDKEDSKVREYLARRADLIGAVRLPNNTFKSAGTQADADIIFLQKRGLLRDTDDMPDWVNTKENKDSLKINRYFAETPDMILGHMKMVTGRFGNTIECVPQPDHNFTDMLSAAVGNLDAVIPEYEHDLTDEALPAPPEVKNFTFTQVDGKIYYREHGLLIPQNLNAVSEARIAAMDDIRLTARALIDLQPTSGSESEIIKLREELNKSYDDFCGRFGKLHDRTNERLFAKDVDSNFLKALEAKQTDGSYGKTDIFTKRTVDPRKTFSQASSAADAMYMSLNIHGSINFNTIMSLYPKSFDEIVSELGDSVYQNPAKWYGEIWQGWETREEYLSGNVRKKIKEAEAACADNPELFQRNIEVLKDNQPEWIEAGQIEVRLGASWVGKDYFNQFMWETFDTPFWLKTDNNQGIHIEYNYHTSEWSVQNAGKDSGIKAREVFGTKRANAYSLLQDTLNLKDTTIRDRVDDKVYVVNNKETQLARAKQTQIKNAFRSWIFADSERRHHLVDKYNNMFNSVRHRNYDGGHLTLPGLSSNFMPYDHQLSAVARICDSGNHTLLDHVVGAGKTATMIIGGFERVRLGASHRAMFVVPNHIVGQFGDDIYRLYPNARAMVVTEKDFEKSNRQQFLSRISFSDIDMIVIGHSQFEKIRMSSEYQSNMLEKEINEITASIQTMKSESGSRWSIKDMERTKISMQTRLERLQNDSEKDTVITFEQLGVDLLNVDEADVFKNCYIFTKLRNVAGVGTAASQRAADMLMKCRYINESGGKLVFATGTPISNALSEMYVMQRYLQEDALHEQGIYHFDEWVSDFAETTSSMELAPEGIGFRQRTRLSKYFNLPELMQLYRQVADVQYADMLKLPRPAIKNGEPTIVLCEPSEDLLLWVQDGVQRCRDIRNRKVPPEEDNMLKFTLETKLAGLDMRLVDPDTDYDPNGKIAMCAKNIMEVYHETQAENGVQIVFCDSSTPNPNRFNVYAELKQVLTEGGVSINEIAFIHDAKNDKAKEDLFDKCRKGEIRVLIGSTEKCGAGTNIQKRLAALHHIDCPYRPRDIEQREGRIIRQGNMYSEVSIFRYVTEKSFDAYLWNIIATKQRFISQVRQGSSTQRSFEDKDETLLSFEAVQAIASGNPLIMEKINLDNRVSQLQLLLSDYNNQRYRLQDQIEVQLPAQREKLTHLIKNLSGDCETVKAHSSDDFVMTVGGKVYEGRDEAGNALIEFSRTVEPDSALAVGEYKRLSVELVHEPRGNAILIRLKGAGIYLAELNEASGVGTSTRIDNLVKELPAKHRRAVAEFDQLEKSFSSAVAEIGRSFEFAEELEQGIERQAELNALLSLEDKPDEENTEEKENIDEHEQDNPDVQKDKSVKAAEISDDLLEYEDDFAINY